MRESLKRIGTLTLRNLKEIARDPLSLVFTLLMPLFMEILFYFIFHNLTSQFEMKYLAPGIVVFSHSFLTLFTGLLISLDRNTSFLTRLYVSKARSFEFILSYAVAVLPIALLQSLLFFIVGGLFDTSLFCPGMLLAVALSLVTALFFIAAGILLGSLCGEKSIGGVASALIAGQSVLSGMWFPVEGLDPAMIAVMDALPFRNATQLIQNALNGTDDPAHGILIPMLIVLAYTVAAFAAAVAVFGAKMRSN